MPKLALLILVLGLLLTYGSFLQQGPRSAPDLPLNLSQTSTKMLSRPYAWSTANAEGLGEYKVTTLWSWPLDLLQIIPLFGILPVILLGIWSIRAVSEMVGLSTWGRVVATLIFLVNSYILVIVDGGQLSIALAYSWLPLTYVAVTLSVDTGQRQKILSGLAVAVLGFFDIRFCYLLLILLGLTFVYRLTVTRVKQKFIDAWFRSGVMITIIVLALHAFWLVPAVLVRLPVLPQSYDQSSQVSFLSFSTLSHSIFLQQPHWYQNVFGRVATPQGVFVILPALAFLAPLVTTNPRVGFWLVVALVGIFLSKGNQPPFGEVYSWLFLHLPGFSLFRDPSKFYLLTALSYSILIGFVVKSIPKISKIGVVAALACLLGWIIQPIVNHQMFGLFSSSTKLPQYQQLAARLDTDKIFSRVLWLPSQTDLTYSDSTHPALEGLRLIQKRPFQVGAVGEYERLNFLREASFAGQLLDIAGVGYIVYPMLDPRRDDLHPDSVAYNRLFGDQLAHLPWVESKIDYPNLTVYKTKKHQEKFFLTPTTFVVWGSDDLYRLSAGDVNLNLADNSLIFAEERPEIISWEFINRFPDLKIVLNKKNLVDLAAGLIPKSHKIFPANTLSDSPNQAGWWKREAADLIGWRSFLQQKYQLDNQDFDLGGGWAVAEGNKKLIIRDPAIIKDQLLLARVLESTRSGEVRFLQGSQLIGSVNTQQAGNNISWFEAGKLLIDGSLEIQTIGEINVVNALAVVEQTQWQQHLRRADQLQQAGRIVEFKSDRVGVKPKVFFLKVNPTKYRVSVQGLSGPVTLVFSQNYDSLWELDGQKPYPVYSLLNGFWIDHNGEYILEFSAQKYVDFGLTISAVTLFTLLILIFLTRKRYTK